MSQISGLTVYPVKGCKGINVHQAKISSTGFAYDRQWVIVQERSMKFESQRKDPKMALIKTAMSTKELAGSNPSADAEMIITVPGQEELKVPLQADLSKLKSECSVWDWTGDALDEGDFASEYLSDFMGHKVRLMRYIGNTEDRTPEESSMRRALDPTFAPKHAETAFSDAMPFLVANEASLEDLNSKCEEVIPMNRFRPNIVVTGFQPWEEDSWQALRLGDIDFTATMPTGRCTVTTVNQATATPSKLKEPLKTLGTYRRGTQLGWDADKSWKGLVFFGWYYLTHQGGVLSVGDSVEVAKTRVGPPQEWTA